MQGAKFSRNGETGVANATEFSEQITQQNIEKGRAAVEKVIQTHEDVRSAMNRPDIGDIDILWGYAGDSNRQYRNGYGISHIIARRNLQGLNGEEVARLMPEIIMRGEKRYGVSDTKIELHYQNYVAVLANNFNGQNVPHWLLTGFRKYETESTNQRGEGFDSSAPTTRTPTPARSTRAANSVSSENIPQTGGNGNIRFSIASSDNSQNSNSSEGLFSKIKNLLTGRPNLQNERIRKKINSLLSNLTGVKIAAGHMNNGLDIVVKDVEKVIRTNRAYDWQNLLPAVGQKIAAILKLNPSGNYIADWLLTGALNNTSAESKNFEKALRDNPEIRENLLEIQNTFAKWHNMTPSERIQAIIEFERPKPTLNEKVKTAKKEGYQQLFEELEPVNDLVKQWQKITGEKLADAVNPYSLLRNYRGIAGRAKLLIEGDESAINALKQMFPQMKWDDFKTIKRILSEIGALENEQVGREFSAFCEAKHVKDMFNKNREIQAAQLKIKDRISELEEMKNQTTDAKRIKDLDKRIKQNQEKLENLNLYDTPMTESDCDATIKDYSTKYDTAQKDLVKFSNAMLTILKNSGVISETAYFNMLREWKNYVPMHRVFDENEDIKFGDSLKKMQGSSRGTVDPLQSIIRNTYDYIRRAEKNEAKLMLASMARTGGVGMLVEEVDGKQPDDKTTIMFYENGVKKYLQTDVSAVRAVNNMTPPSMSWFTKFLRIGTMLLRNFATVYNPSFAARNLIRDPQDTFIYSKYGFFSPMDFVRGFIHAVKQDDVYAEWMAAGGAQASFWSVDRDYTEASINNLTKRGLKKYASLNGFFDLFSRLGEWSELGTRIGYFEKAKKAIAEKNGGKIDRAALATAGAFFNTLKGGCKILRYTLTKNYTEIAEGYGVF